MRRPFGRSSLALLAVAATFAACGPIAPTSPPSGAASTTPSQPPSPSIRAASPPALPAGVTVDPGLLEVLPAEIDGVTVEPDATAAAEIAGDPLLAESALSIAVAFVGKASTSGSEDLAVASVIRLRPDVFDEAFYQEWRDAYNEAACEVADGVESEEETEIGGRLVYAATCVGGAQTYHTYLEDQGFLVSITATGEQRFGELILAGLAQ